MAAKTHRGAAQRGKILTAAKHLFARQGFGSTGVRQIAEKAGVNPAMINYYFGSKQGLLNTVLSGYFDTIAPQAAAAFARGGGVRESLREIVAAFTELLRDDLELVRILVSQLPLDRAEHTAFPEERLAGIVELVSRNVLPRLEEELGHPVQLQVIMPALMGMVLGHFLSRPAFEKITGVRCDDDFYARFPDLVVGVLFDGFSGTDVAEMHPPALLEESS